ncbi:MAG: mechanosensitive ion channel family protein [Planctomycetota bacterium]
MILTERRASLGPVRVGSTILLLLLAGSLVARPTSAQEAPAQKNPTGVADESISQVPTRIDVEPVAEDADIATRLTRILDATGWFEEPKVRVAEGVVFLTGRVDDEQHKQWAGQLAGNTQAVVAVVNRIEVAEKSMWDISPAWLELQSLGAETVQNSPLMAIGLLLLVATWFASKSSVRSARWLLRRRLHSALLRDVAARAVAVPVFLLGLYLVLKVSGLTRLAMTVLGGTGILGLILGFAFRDIAENFLASILISMQRPFASGDLIEVAGCKGFVQSVNIRSTLLMTLEGNHVQIPNATIYKETITNFTANPKARFDFAVGIGYDDSISEAQSVGLSVLRDHPAVVDEPEPLVLVESLGAATVNLRIYFWVDIAKYSQLKVRSAVIRLTKRAFEAAGISMPDEAREVVFPAGVPVRMLSADQVEEVEQERRQLPVADDASTAHSAEGDLTSEAEDIEQQARMARSPESGQNLLES